MNESTASNPGAPAPEVLRRYFSRGDRFADHCGIELLEVGAGTARARMKVREWHRNSVGIVHGGAVFTLADFVFAAASNSYGTVALALNVSITFLRKTEGGTLFAEAEEVDCNPRLGNYAIRVTDESGALVATFQGLAYRKKDPLPLENGK